MIHSPLTYNQTVNLIHILVIAPAVLLALTPNLLEKFRVMKAESFVTLVKCVVVGMIIYHVYKFSNTFFYKKTMIELPVE